VFGVGTPGSRSEERRRAEGVLDPLAEIIGVTPGGQSEAEATSKPAAGQPSAASAETGVREVSPQARLALPRSG
jgi:hypothetical protein